MIGIETQPPQCRSATRLAALVSLGGACHSASDTTASHGMYYIPWTFTSRLHITSMTGTQLHLSSAGMTFVMLGILATSGLQIVNRV